MIRSGFLRLSLCLAFGAASPFFPAKADTGQSSEFKEVYDLVRKHLPGMSETELDKAAVQGLVSGLGPKVALVSGETESAAREGALVSRTNLFDGGIAYVRVGRVAEGLPEALRQACSHISGTNELNGMVLDLRFADGQDYAAAAATADLFLTKERPLLDWGDGLKQSKEKADALALPVAVMVNHETAGAAEALAAVLRQTGAGLVLGARTAGKAMIAQDYPLAGGDHLRILVAPIHLGDGSDLTSDGVKPDIAVNVPPQAEKSFFADAFKDPARTNSAVATSLSASNTVAGTSRARRPRFNEAELVRERRDGYVPDPESADGGDADPDRPVVRDPVLARALDVLKGLAVVRRAHS